MSRVASHLSLVAGGAVALPGERFPAGSAGDHARPFWPERPTLGELFPAHPRDAGWAGFMLAGNECWDGPVLWIQERMAILESGRIHPPGLPRLDLIHVTARDARSVLWAMEEGLRCAGLSFVVGEIWGDPAALDFTATRRLAVAAERSGVGCWLVRLGGSANLSGARQRWRIASLPSLANPFDPKAPGTPAWDADLFRARGQPPGRWAMAGEAAPDAHPVDRLSGAGPRPLGAVFGGVRRSA